MVAEGGWAASHFFWVEPLHLAAGLRAPGPAVVQPNAEQVELELQGDPATAAGFAGEDCSVVGQHPAGLPWRRKARRKLATTSSPPWSPGRRMSTYTANALTKLCREPGIRQSMGRAGSCFDAAAAEALFSSLGWEVLLMLRSA